MKYYLKFIIRISTLILIFTSCERDFVDIKFKNKNNGNNSLSTNIIFSELWRTDSNLVNLDNAKGWRVYNGIDTNDNLFVVNSEGNQVNSTSKEDFKLKKFDSTGNLLWTQIYDIFGGDDKVFGILVDNSDRVFIFGSAETKVNGLDLLLMRVNPINGDVLWTKTLDGNGGDDIIQGVFPDASGDLIVAAEGVNIVNSASQKDNWLLKYDIQGNKLSSLDVKHDYENNNVEDGLRDVTIIDDGSIYVTGYGVDLVGVGSGEDLTVYKYSPTGVILGSYKYDGFKNDDSSATIYAPTTMITDLNNHIYVGGIGTWLKGLSGWDDIFIKKFDNTVSSGTINEITTGWNKVVGTGGSDYLEDFYVDNSNNLYFAGSKRTPGADWWSLRFNESGVQDAGFEIQISTDESGYDGWDNAQSLVMDSSNNIILSGEIWKYAQNGGTFSIRKFDSTTGAEIPGNFHKTYDKNFLENDHIIDLLSNSENIFALGKAHSLATNYTSENDWFIKKFNNSGVEITDDGWNINIDGEKEGDDIPSQMAIDNTNNALYVVGQGTKLVSDSSAGDIWIKKYNLATGAEITTGWNKKIDNSDGDDFAVSIKITNSGEVYVLSYGENLSAPGSNYDWSIKKYQSDGVEITTGWDKTIDGNDSDKSVGLALDYSENLYVLGYGKNLVSGLSGNDWWIKKFQSSGDEITTGWNKILNINDGNDIPKNIKFINNKIYVYGQVENLVSDSSNQDILIKIYNIDGTEVDSPFASGIDFSNQNDNINDVLLDNNNGIWAIAKTTDSAGIEYSRIKVYNQNTKSIYSYDSLEKNLIYTVGLLNSNKIIFGGHSYETTAQNSGKDYLLVNYSFSY